MSLAAQLLAAHKDARLPPSCALCCAQLPSAYEAELDAEYVELIRE